MDDQTKSGGGSQQAADTPGARDLSFLWPVIDRIRAVEIKFQADSAAPAGEASGGQDLAGGVEARLQALETDIAAIKQTLQDTLGALTSGVAEAADAVAEARVELAPPSSSRVVFGAAVSIGLLLLAHWLIVFVYDKPTLVLRLVSIAIPLPIGLWLTLRYRIHPWFEVAIALTIGSLAVFGMSYVTGIHEKTSFLPENMREWQETIEYIASIAFAYLTGGLISSALQARSGAGNRAGQATLKLAQVLATVTGKAIEKGPQLKKHVDMIHGLVNNLMPVASAIVAVVTGLKGILN
jgi:hypothetical protein